MKILLIVIAIANNNNDDDDGYKYSSSYLDNHKQAGHLIQ